MDNPLLAKYRFFFAKLQKLLLTAIVLFLAASIPPQTASAQSRERSGKEVVDAVCAACHLTGAKGSPKIGDEKAWAKLASRGLTDLTKNALKGVRDMPAHGGNMALTDGEIERAITYMVNRSGGKWNEPVSEATFAVERRGEQVVQMQCAKCHQSGAGGAPKIGDRNAWIPRLKRGLEFVVRSAINGHGPMPPRGGMADLTDSEIRSAVIYMYNPGQIQVKDASASLPVAPSGNHKIISGTEIFLGSVAAESMRAQYAKGSPESSMHGGIPDGKDYYHVNISLFDSKTRAAITDAQVEVNVRDPVSGGTTKKLDLVTINNMKSYGNYFRMSGKNAHTITVHIRRPGVPQAIEAKFEFKG